MDTSTDERKRHMCACYDCGSTIEGHHTELCEMAEDNAVRDLPAHPGTQWWTEAVGHVWMTPYIKQQS